MSQEYRAVVRDFLGGWSGEQRDEIREKALIELASEAKDAICDNEVYKFLERDTLENYLDGEETVGTEHLRSAFKNVHGIPLEPERQLEKAEEQYAREKAKQSLEDSSVKTSFDVSDRVVDIKIPDSNYLEFLERFQEYGGETTLRLQKDITVDIGDEEQMREEAESEGIWEIDMIRPSVQFSGGAIESEYDSDTLVIEAEEYTEEFEEVLDKLGL